jgi:hypothetical protein
VQHAQDAQPMPRKLGKNVGAGETAAGRLTSDGAAPRSNRSGLRWTQSRRNLRPRKRHTSPPAGQFFRDLANQVSLDLPWTWSKNESHRIRATFRCKTRIFKVGVAANLDPHGGSHLLTGERSAAARSRLSSALPGSGWRISDSPIRKAWNPRRATGSGLRPSRCRFRSREQRRPAAGRPDRARPRAVPQMS